MSFNDFFILPGIDSIRVLTISIESFSHSSRMTAGRSERDFYAGHPLLTAFFRTIHKFSIGLKSVPCAGHSRIQGNACFYKMLLRWLDELLRYNLAK